MPASPILHNLHERSPRLVGFDALGVDLLRRLACQHRQSVYSIEGLGASGKTALALEIAWEIVRNPQGYPYHVVAWIAARNPALVPIGPTPTSSRCRPEPHSLARICSILGALLDEPGLLDAATCGDSSQQFATLKSALSERRILLVLDEIEQVVPEEEALLHELLHTLPSPSTALVTARHYHGFPFPTRMTWLTDDQMDDFIARECDDSRVPLNSLEQRQVREWAHGLPFAARVALCRIQHVGLARAMADFSRGPAPLVRPVIGQNLVALRRDHYSSYLALQRLATHGINRGMMRTAVLRTLDPDPSIAIKLLKPLLKANLVVCTQINGHDRLAISPLLHWYLLEHMGRHPSSRDFRPNCS